MDIHRLLLHYMRALLFLCGATFVAFAIVLSALGVPYRFTAGLYRVSAGIHSPGGTARRRRHYYCG